MLEKMLRKKSFTNKIMLMTNKAKLMTLIEMNTNSQKQIKKKKLNWMEYLMKR